MTDKPAATVHGTGSGEVRQDYIRCCFATPRRYRINGNVIVCDNCGREVELPTPPASPTVTVDRETALRYADEVIAELGRCIPPYQHLSRTLIADALLRAAERQK